MAIEPDRGLLVRALTDAGQTVVPRLVVPCARQVGAELHCVQIRSGWLAVPAAPVVAFTKSMFLAEPPVDPSPDSECGPAGWLTPEQVRQRCVTCTWLPFLTLLRDARHRAGVSSD